MSLQFTHPRYFVSTLVTGETYSIMFDSACSFRLNFSVALYSHWSQVKRAPSKLDSTCLFRLLIRGASYCIGHTYSKLLHDLIHHVSLDYSSEMLCIHIALVTDKTYSLMFCFYMKLHGSLCT